MTRQSSRRKALLNWIVLDRETAVPLHQQIIQQLRGAVLDGTLDPGAYLPASRALARDLGDFAQYLPAGL